MCDTPRPADQKTGDTSASPKPVQQPTVTKAVGNWKYVPSRTGSWNSDLAQSLKCDDPQTVIHLVQSKGGVGLVDEQGYTALHWCTDYKAPQCAEALLREGALMDAKDPMGRTTLHWAANYGAVKICALLLAAGADFLATDNSGQTPEEIAQAVGKNQQWTKAMKETEDIRIPPSMLRYAGVELRDPAQLLADVGIGMEAQVEFVQGPSARHCIGKGKGISFDPAEDGPLTVFVSSATSEDRVVLEVAVDCTVGAFAARAAEILQSAPANPAGPC